MFSHLSNVEEIISREKKCLCYLLAGLLISNDLYQVLVYNPR